MSSDKPTVIETENLKLVLDSPDSARESIGAMTPAERAQLSADWLALVESATTPNPWIHGFTMYQRSDSSVVGSCGFKGPPTPDGMVEIAYGVQSAYRSRGYATQAAQALTTFAFRDGAVRVVRAHTLPQANASTRVLIKSGFSRIGEVIDRDDGLVWRWELNRASS